MYKLLLVDDEEEVRKGVLQKIDWEKYGFEVADEAENGRDALEIAEKTLPDVVITDIKMPFMDGLQLAEALNTVSPTTRVIVLTGFDEFEYAQKALRLNVAEYVLKPISASELVGVLVKVKQRLDEELAQREDIAALREYYRKSLPLLREKFLASLITTSMDRDEVFEKAMSFDMKLKGKAYVVSAVSIDHNQVNYCKQKSGIDGTGGVLNAVEDHELSYFAALNIIDEVISKQELGYAFIHEDYIVIVTVFQSQDKEDIVSRIFSAFEEIRKIIEKYLKFTVTIGIGNICTDIGGLIRSYKNAASALDYRVVIGNNRLLWIEDIEPKRIDRIVFDENKEHLLVSSIKVGTESEIAGTIDKLFEEITDTKTSFENYQVYLMEILTTILKVAKSSDVSMGNLFGSSYNLFVELYRFNNLEEVKYWLKDISIRVGNYIVKDRQDTYQLLVVKAKDYVKDHYHESDVTINGVCDYLHISPTYFSFIFKRETKTTFINYLTNMRMDVAKELLRTTNLKAFEIAEKVGYAEPNYFSYSFKKKFGQSPSEYRNSTS